MLAVAAEHVVVGRDGPAERLRDVVLRSVVLDLEHLDVEPAASIAGHVLGEAYDPATLNLNMGVVRARLGRAKDVNWVKAKDNPDMNAQAGFSGLADMYDMLLQRMYGGAAPTE